MTPLKWLGLFLIVESVVVIYLDYREKKKKDGDNNVIVATLLYLNLVIGLFLLGIWT